MLVDRRKVVFGFLHRSKRTTGRKFPDTLVMDSAQFSLSSTICPRFMPREELPTPKQATFRLTSRCSRGMMFGFESVYHEDAVRTRHIMTFWVFLPTLLSIVRKMPAIFLKIPTIGIRLCDQMAMSVQCSLSFNALGPELLCTRFG